MADRLVPVGVLREAARAYMEATSVRRAAAATGLSPTGLRAFIGGTTPHPATVRKLTEWYVRAVAKRDEELTEETARAALALLTAHLAGHQVRAERELLSLLSRLGSAAGVPAPDWLSAMVTDESPGLSAE